MGALGQAGVGLLGTAANIAFGAKQIELAHAQRKDAQAQREIENARYNAQLERLNKATNDAVATASGLKSAQTQMAQTQQNAQQAQAKKPAQQNMQTQNPQQAQQATQDATTRRNHKTQPQELPMQRQ